MALHRELRENGEVATHMVEGDRIMRVAAGLQEEVGSYTDELEKPLGDCEWGGDHDLICIFF